MSVLFIFLDGVGIGPSDPDRNPFLRAHLPFLTEALEGAVPTLDRPRRMGPRAAAFPLDATLGMAGTPQSGTGQTALLTGRNTPEMFGRHFGPWPPVRLRSMLDRENLLKRSVDAGRRVAFANAYPRGWPGSIATRKLAAPPLAARAAGLLTRHAEALAEGDAVASEIVNRAWRIHLGHRGLPEVTPEGAGANLARIALRHDLTFYAHYATDHAGHRGGMEGAIAALERVDAFLGGVAAGLGEAVGEGPSEGLAEGPDEGPDEGPEEDTHEEMVMLVASDHGNVEDIRGQHTRNPALGLVFAPGAADVRGPAAGEIAARLSAITDVPRVIGQLLGGR